MTNRAQMILIAACCAGALAFVGVQIFRGSNKPAYGHNTTFTERARLAEVTDSGVHVTVSLESDPQGKPLLRATFTPDPGFHVYSKDLDTKASEGVGVPTQFELLPNPSIKAAGPLFADVAPERHENVDIYPDGPVTLRLPIQFVGANTNVAAQVAVSYMACKTGGVCLRPIQRQIVNIQIASQ